MNIPILSIVMIMIIYTVRFVTNAVKYTQFISLKNIIVLRKLSVQKKRVSMSNAFKNISLHELHHF
jgi:hypothetical protein